MQSDFNIIFNPPAFLTPKITMNKTHAKHKCCEYKHNSVKSNMVHARWLSIHISIPMIPVLVQLARLHNCLPQTPQFTLSSPVQETMVLKNLYDGHWVRINRIYSGKWRTAKVLMNILWQETNITYFFIYLVVLENQNSFTNKIGNIPLLIGLNLFTKTLLPILYVMFE